ncbi:MAG: hypothetical protein UZ21_OP11001001101 [Microgenomates bacterium OLB22]|nr:MAG: hypothetical protein UZ21_OP11001001101 [Microgenomates bacterium OLB22]
MLPQDNPQLLYEWSAPARAYKKNTGGILRFYIAVALLLAIIVFLWGDKFLLLPIFSVLFIFYVLTTTPPRDVHYKITKFGVFVGDSFYKWEDLTHFSIVKQFEMSQIVITAHIPFEFHVHLTVIDETSLSKLMSLLSEHLIYQEKAELSISEKLLEFFSKLMPQA